MREDPGFFDPPRPTPGPNTQRCKPCNACGAPSLPLCGPQNTPQPNPSMCAVAGACAADHHQDKHCRCVPNKVNWLFPDVAQNPATTFGIPTPYLIGGGIVLLLLVLK